MTKESLGFVIAVRDVCADLMQEYSTLKRRQFHESEYGNERLDYQRKNAFRRGWLGGQGGLLLDSARTSQGCKAPF